MRVKELSLQGFKSFASKHRFAFRPGITAVVGPNGSGKSNIADAIRWVLGEHRATSLRAKRTDQMIFAGTAKRPRAGLAEVSLTFDNEDRWLDIDFAEVVVTRRALRDGTNTYLINDAQVRLRDVVDLLGGQLGQGAFTVIGQGLVDSALSMRPDERRLLIDEAAGIVPLQRRRQLTLRRLAETDENLTRVRDIMDELEPQLRRMRRLAQRAERHEQVSEDLRDALLTWYGHQWHQAGAVLDEARMAAATLTRDRAEVAADVERQSAALREAEEVRESKGAALDALRRERDDRLAEAATTRQGAAVARARLEGMLARQRELSDSGETAGESLSDLRAAAARLEAEVGTLSADQAQFEARAAAARAALDHREQEREAQAAAIERQRAELLELRSSVAAERHRLENLEATRASREAERRAAEGELDTLLAGLPQERAEAEAAEAGATETDAERTRLADATAAQDRTLHALGRALGAARDGHDAARRKRESLETRAAALDSLFGELEGMREWRSRLMDGRTVEIVGSVAELLEVAPEWESALAAALGERVHGLVVRDDGAVDAALAVLAKDARGRLTLVPLSGRHGHHAPWDDRSGIVRAESVVGSRDSTGLVPALLGGTAFADGVAEARAALGADRPPPRVATRDGLLVLPHGVVSATPSAREALTIQRERRALPSAIEAAVSEEEERLAAVDALAADRRAAEGRLGELAEGRTVAERLHREASDRRDGARARLDRTERAHRWHVETIARIDEELAGLEERRIEAETRLAEQLPRQRDLADALEAARDQLAESDLGAARDEVTRTGATAAQGAQALAARRAMSDAVREELRGAEASMSDEQARGQQMAEEIAQLTAQVATLDQRVDALGEALDALDAQLAPLAAASRGARSGLHTLVGAVEESRARLSSIESRLVDARVHETRATDRLERLLEQLRADAELVGIEDLALGGDEPPAAVTSPTEPIDTLPEGLEGRITKLRRELRAIGAIDQEALSAFRDSSEHLEHLASQRADLEGARADLREVLDRLETEMAERFEATFVAVAEAFQSFFPQLFAGGEAELVLVGDDDRAPGIDILARPPGKRQQPLELLSGGERSLTAVALIFALLRVSGTPFAVLDEVDAALDEANVGRFRDALEALAADTQVMIVTHNRGTIQAADTVYGITMQEDGASQVISLKVDEAT